jgi:hypothetical protein
MDLWFFKTRDIAPDAGLRRAVAFLRRNQTLDLNCAAAFLRGIAVWSPFISDIRVSSLKFLSIVENQHG